MYSDNWSAVYTDLSVLIIGSVVGVKTRLWLQRAFADVIPGPMFPLSAAQFVGCAVMGIAVGAQKLLSRLHPSTYLLFTTGLAASITSFSSWIVQLCQLWIQPSTQAAFRLSDNWTESIYRSNRSDQSDQSNQLDQLQNVAYRLQTIMVNIIVTLSISQAAFLIGLHFGQSIDRLAATRQSINNSFSTCDRRLYQLRFEHRTRRLHRFVAVIYRFVSTMVLIWLTVSVAWLIFGPIPQPPQPPQPSGMLQVSKPTPDAWTQGQMFSPIGVESDDDRLPTQSINASTTVQSELIHGPSLWTHLSAFAQHWILPDKQMTATYLLAPCGTWLRWRLSLSLNNRITAFICLGTFVANIISSVISMAIHLASPNLLTSSPLLLSAQLLPLLPLLHSINDGFCGGLSTVSTFISELLRLPLLAAYGYALISIVGISGINIAFWYLFDWLIVTS